jgi:hypothetical protein
MKIKGIYFLKNHEHNSLIAKQYILFWREVVYIVYSKSSSICSQEVYTFQFDFEQYVYSKLCSMFARSIYLSL